MALYFVNHTTRYHYNQVVPISHHSAKLLPRDLANQKCISSEIKVFPMPSVMQEGTDYFGNRTQYFTISEPHQTLEVAAISHVEVTSVPDLPQVESTPPWEFLVHELSDVRNSEYFDVYSYIFPSPLIYSMKETMVYAETSFTPGRPILEAALDLTHRIYEEFIFDPTATHVHTPLSEVISNKRGVCQDFAHFEIACLRSLGLPARYVSGYLRTIPPEGEERLRGADASHAWVQIYCPKFGWIGLDPTNNLIPDEDHITVAWGRDYGDVSPLLGITYGGGNQLLEVSVDVEPLQS